MGQETGRERQQPKGTGEPGEEQVQAITDDQSDKKTGQDHSTEHHEETEPESGVGAVQDREDTVSDIARIRDEE
jgi:hypothetical protein